MNSIGLAVDNLKEDVNMKRKNTSAGETPELAPGGRLGVGMKLSEPIFIRWRPSCREEFRRQAKLNNLPDATLARTILNEYLASFMKPEKARELGLVREWRYAHFLEEALEARSGRRGTR